MPSILFGRYCPDLGDSFITFSISVLFLSCGVLVDGEIFLFVDSVFLGGVLLTAVVLLVGGTTFLSVFFSVGFNAGFAASFDGALKVDKSLLSVRLINVVLPFPQLDLCPGDVCHFPTSCSSLPSFL